MPNPSPAEGGARQAPSVELAPASESKPARNYSWSPFEAGHTSSLTHGTYSPRAIAEKASEVHQELLRFAPWLGQEVYAPQLQRYLQATAREQLAHRALVTAEQAGKPPSPRLLETATAASRLAWKMADQLGLSPLGHARLKAMTADAEISTLSLADLIAEGASIREAAQARMADVIDADLADEDER